ncbi:MAG: hypothetical protein AAF806_25930, partial [Bacteroidota bacterium]
KVDGTAKIFIIKDVEVKANATQRVEHNFQTGTIKVGVRSETNLVDATIRIFDTSTGKSMATARTYQSESSNPKEFILTIGNYRVEIKALKEYEGKQSAFNIGLRSGQTIERIIKL